LLLFLTRYNIIPSESGYEAELGVKILLISLALTLAAYWVVFPRKHEIHDNRVKVVPGAYSYSISLKSIEEVKKVSGSKVFAYYNGIL